MAISGAFAITTPMATSGISALRSAMVVARSTLVASSPLVGGCRFANRVHDGNGGRFVETGIAQRGDGGVSTECAGAHSWPAAGGGQRAFQVRWAFGYRAGAPVGTVQVPLPPSASVRSVP